MRLYATSTSPYARKCLLVAHERKLIDRLAIVLVDNLASAELARENPLNKVPALVLDDGSRLIDSPVICEYLDSIHADRPLIPPAGPARWRALSEQALADGICDAAVLRMVEGRRPKELQSAEWVAKQTRKITQGLDELAQVIAGRALDDATTIGDLAIVVALAYLDLRFPGDEWRATRPALADWFIRTSDREGFRATAPPA